MSRMCSSLLLKEWPPACTVGVDRLQSPGSMKWLFRVRPSYNAVIAAICQFSVNSTHCHRAGVMIICKRNWSCGSLFGSDAGFHCYADVYKVVESCSREWRNHSDERWTVSLAENVSRWSESTFLNWIIEDASRQCFIEKVATVTQQWMVMKQTLYDNWKSLKAHCVKLVGFYLSLLV